MPVKRIFFSALSLLCFLVCCGTAFSAPARLQFSEVHVRLREDGKASVTQTIRYQISDATLQGFYFQGWGRAKPVFDVANSAAFTDTGERIALEIKDLGDKIDIVLDTAGQVSTINFTP